MSNRKLLAFLLCLCAYLQPIASEAHLSGKNVCYRVKTSIEPVKVKQVARIEGKPTAEYVESFVWENRTVQKEVPICCPGFVEMAGECKPHCTIGCVQGDCVGPDKCDCLPGFGGEYCNKTCPTGQFGLNCEHNCACLIDPHCNHNYSDCSCRPGETPSNECKDICKCRSSTCEVGYHGKNCSLTCPEHTFGANCIHQCLCKRENTLSCSRTSGDCECKEPFYGIDCAEECLGNLRCDTKKRCKCMDGVNNLHDFVNALVLVLRRTEKSNDSETQADYSWLLVLLLLVVCGLLVYFAYRYRQAPKKRERRLQRLKKQLDVEGMRSEIENASQMAAIVAKYVMDDAKEGDESDEDDEGRSQRKKNCQSALEEIILNFEKAKKSRAAQKDLPTSSSDQAGGSILAKFRSMFRCASGECDDENIYDTYGISLSELSGTDNEMASQSVKETPMNAVPQKS